MMKLRNLSVLAYSGLSNFTAWIYQSDQALSAVLGTLDYFADAGSMLNIGDIIVLRCADDTAIRAVKIIDGHIVLVHVL